MIARAVMASRRWGCGRRRHASCSSFSRARTAPMRRALRAPSSSVNWKGSATSEKSTARSPRWRSGPSPSSEPVEPNRERLAALERVGGGRGFGRSRLADRSSGAHPRAQTPSERLRCAKSALSSKPASRWNPTVGRFDSCAAPSDNSLQNRDFWPCGPLPDGLPPCRSGRSAVKRPSALGHSASAQLCVGGLAHS
jgi:hypothetical protein